jgi:hypothetical protein
MQTGFESIEPILLKKKKKEKKKCKSFKPKRATYIVQSIEREKEFRSLEGETGHPVGAALQQARSCNIRIHFVLISHPEVEVGFDYVLGHFMNVLKRYLDPSLKLS